MTLSLFRVDIYTRQPHVLRDFYEQVLGLKLVYASPDQSSFELSSGGATVVIVKSMTEVKNRVRLCFSNPDLKACRLMMTANNVTISATRVKEGKFFFELKDPDGNEVAIYQS